MPHEVGQTIGDRYVLQRAIAKSSQCAVYEARHTYTKRRVAMRLLDGDLQHDDAAGARLLHEAELLTQVRHRSVVEVLDAGNGAPHGPFLASEMLDGRGLDGVLAVRRRLTVRHSFQVALALADAFGRIHELGLVHAALQPGSVFLPTPRDAARGDNDLPPAKLLGFGLSPSAAGIVEGPLAAMAYASAERLAGVTDQPHVDVYALAAIAFECLTGQLPGAEQGPGAFDARALREEVPAPLSGVIERALGVASDRYADSGKMAIALREAYAREPPKPEDVIPHRRAATRATYATPVLVLRNEGGAVEGRSEDISEGGLLAVSHARLEERERVNLTFALPLSFDVVTVTAVCRWQKSARDGANAVGFQFIDPGGDVIEDIREYVAFFGGALV